MSKPKPQSARRSLGKISLDARVLLAENLRLRRKQLGLSQERAAEMVGFSLQYLQRIERRIVNVPLDTIAKFAHAYGVELYELFRDVQQGHPDP